MGFCIQGDQLHRTETHLCEISHCGKPQEFVTICHQHVREAETELRQFTAEEIIRLYAIARGEEKSAEKVARKTMNQAITEDVLDLATYDLAQNITHHWPNLIPFIAAHPDGAQLYWKILAGCNLAQSKINGDPEWNKEQRDHAHLQARYPMTLKELIPFMHDYLNITITPEQIWKWKQRGKIEAIKPLGQREHMYTPKQVFEAYWK